VRQKKKIKFSRTGRNKRITVITPSYRINNLIKIKKSINFNYIDEWIIVYDGTIVRKNPHLFKDTEKIKEYLVAPAFKDFNPHQRQTVMRNYALDKVSHKNTYIYYLDDDNTIHPNLYKLLDRAEGGKLYTFNQQWYSVRGYVGKGGVTRYRRTFRSTRPYCRCKGREWRHLSISQRARSKHIRHRCVWGDTGQMLIDYSICADIRWDEDFENSADGNYIKECYKQNQDSWVYIDDTLCYHNSLRPVPPNKVPK